MQLLAVFAKTPIPGRVKTRLTPPLTPDSAASLHQAFVRDTVRICEQIPHAICELHTDTHTDAFSDLAVTRKLQIPGDLGLKMLHALSAGAATGASRVLILGADAPTISSESLLELLRIDADVAIGPAEDGGYYAIAARQTHPGMFAGVHWGSAAALVDTIASCAASGLSVSLGPVWYDVDTPQDLSRLRNDPNLGPHTREWFRTETILSL